MWNARSSYKYSETMPPWALRLRNLTSVLFQTNYSRDNPVLPIPQFAQLIINNASTLKTLGLHTATFSRLAEEAPEPLEILQRNITRLSFLSGAIRGDLITAVAKFGKLTSLQVELSSTLLEPEFIPAIVANCRKLSKLGFGNANLNVGEVKQLWQLEELTKLGFGWFADSFRAPAWKLYEHSYASGFDPYAVIGVIPKITPLMPPQIGINFFLWMGSDYMSFVEVASSYTNIEVCEHLIGAGADLNRPLFHSNHSVFHGLIGSFKLTARPMITYGLEKDLVDPGLLMDDYGNTMSFFHKISHLFADNFPLDLVANVYGRQLDKARRLHPEHEPFFYRTTRGETIIMCALRTIPATHPIMEYLWQNAERLGCSPADVDMDGGCAAHHAVRRWNQPVDIVADLNNLVGHGVDINTRNGTGHKVFHSASIPKCDAMIAAADALGIVIDAADVSLSRGEDPNGMSMLMFACRNSAQHVVASFLKVASPASMGGTVLGFTPLHAAACSVNAAISEGNTIELLKNKEALQLDLEPILLTAKTWTWLPGPAAGHGVTPLLIAVAFNYAATADLLLAAGARIDVFHPVGSSPIHLAAERGSLPILKSLCSRLPKGSPLLTHQNRSGFTPLLYIVYKLGLISFDHDKVREMAELLIETAGDEAAKMINIVDASGRTALFYCRRRRVLSLCDLLIKHGATPIAENFAPANPDALAVVPL